MTVDGLAGFTSNDLALMAEAVRRVRASRGQADADPAAITRAVSTALLQGRRDLFGLVKAGCSAG